MKGQTLAARGEMRGCTAHKTTHTALPRQWRQRDRTNGGEGCAAADFLPLSVPLSSVDKRVCVASKERQYADGPSAASQTSQHSWGGDVVCGSVCGGGGVTPSRQQELKRSNHFHAKVGFLRTWFALLVADCLRGETCGTPLGKRDGRRLATGVCGGGGGGWKEVE